MNLENKNINLNEWIFLHFMIFIDWKYDSLIDSISCNDQFSIYFFAFLHGFRSQQLGPISWYLWRRSLDRIFLFQRHYFSPSFLCQNWCQIFVRFFLCIAWHRKPTGHISQLRDQLSGPEISWYWKSIFAVGCGLGCTLE